MVPPLADHTGAWFERRLSAEIADHICTFLPWNRDALTGLVENLLRGNNQVKQRQLNWLQACSAFHQNPTDSIAGERFDDFVAAGWIKRKALPKKKGDELQTRLV